MVDILIEMGAAIDVINEYPLHGERVGDLRVRSSNLRGGSLSGSLIPQLIDEIPILAVLAPRTQEGIHIRTPESCGSRKATGFKALWKTCGRWGWR